MKIAEKIKPKGTLGVPHFSTIMATTLALFTGAAIWWITTSWFENQLIAEQRAKFQAELISYGENLESTINTRLEIANSLEAFVHYSKDDPNLRARYNIFASGLYEGRYGIRALQIFPPKGSEMIFPITGNEAVIGGGLASLLADSRPEVKADIETTIKTGLLTISGPYTLRQGGLGLVARKAVYNEGEFWGLAVVVLDVPPLLARTGIAPSNSPDLLMAIKDHQGNIFAGDEAVFASNPVTMEISLPGRAWELAGVPLNGWKQAYSTSLLSFQMTGLITIFLIGMLVYAFSSQNERLNMAVKLKTSELRESEKKLKEAQELGAFGSWEYDLSTQSIQWSDQVYKLYGRAPELGPPSVDEEASYYDDATVHTLREITGRARTVGTPGSYDFAANIPSRGKRYFSASVRPVRDETGKIVKLFGTVQDITERKKAEEEIRDLNEHLEKRVKERTEQLQAANKEMEAFSYSVSHDLRAPLRAINGFSRILVEDYSESLDDEGKRICGVISKNAGTMGALIDDLLAFSRLGKASLILASTDMQEMAREVFQEITTGQERERVSFIVEDLPTAEVDPRLMKQVWSNLISNAIKFSARSEHPEIRIRSEIRESETVYSVSDNGVGFDMRHADKLFKVFQRLHGVEEFEGTGVGLAIVHRIIAMHGGEIWAKSEPGHGAEFSFTIGKGA